MKWLRVLDRRIFRQWLPLAFIVTVMAGAIYGTAQVVVRQGANDHPLQAAQDVSAALAAGASPTSTVNSLQPTEISTSLATFITVFDSNYNVIATNGKLNGENPVLPSGVFTYTAVHNEDRVTWQPQDGVRVAAVVRAYKDTSGNTGYVLAGRNLRETESRENQLLLLDTAAWVVAMVGSLGLLFILNERS